MSCTLCPRRCGADRAHGTGYCGAGDTVQIARAEPHYWEEPCLSGKNGSGTIFFTGCALHCVYCQNRKISAGGCGKAVSEDELYGLFVRLQERGVHNINLVTPDHYLDRILPVLQRAKKERFPLPIVMNGSGYETPEMIRALDGLIDIYLPDFKYMSPLLAKKYSAAPDYPAVCKEAICEMVRQKPVCSEGPDGLQREGVLVRHLILPGQTDDSKKILAYLFTAYGNSIRYSIMNQFTPFGLEAYPEINRKVTEEEYEDVVSFALKLGIRNAYIQDGEAASESFIPEFFDA